jgi:hypothetical protein
MKRTYCDGCHAEITGQDIMVVEIDRHRHDFCRTSCYPRYGKYIEAIEALRVETDKAYQEKLSALTTTLWAEITKEVSSGSETQNFLGIKPISNGEGPVLSS